jgi:hypothetical protein
LTGLQAAARATNRIFGNLLGLGLGLAGIGSIVEGMKKSVALSLQNEQIQESTLVILRNQRELRHQNVDLATQDLKILNDQALSLQQQTGLYKNIFERGSNILAQSGRTVGQIKDLQYHIANVLAAQKMQGKSAEDMQATYRGVAQAIEQGMGRQLVRSGVYLTDWEKRLLAMNALTGKYAANMEIVERAMDRTFGGSARARMATLTGQADLALQNMFASMERIGNILKPIGQRLQIIFAQVIPTIEPIVSRLASFIGDALKNHMENIKDWIHMIQSRAIPVMVEWIEKGWKQLQIFAQWIITQKDVIVGAFSAIGVAIGTITDPWKKFAAISQEVKDFLFGTKQYTYKDANPEKRVERALPAVGGVPQGWLEQMLEFTNNWVDNSLIPKVTEWLNKLEPVFRSWWKSVLAMMGDVLKEWVKEQSGGKGINSTDFWWNLLFGGDPGKGQTKPGPTAKWLGQLGHWGMPDVGGTPKPPIPIDPAQVAKNRQGLKDIGALPGGPSPFSDLGKSIEDLNVQTKKLTTNDFTHLNLATKVATDLLTQFTDAMRDAITLLTGQGGGLGQGRTEPAQAGAPNTGSSRGLGLTPSPQEIASGRLKSQAAYAGAVRIMSEWVPGEAKTHATQYGAAGTHLQLGDVAMSVALMKQMGLHLGDYIDILNKAGEVVLAHQHVMDTSWFNNPTRDTHGVELWGRPDMGWGGVRPSIGGGQYAKMAVGGIVNRPTRTLLGEAGPEAVVPLNRAGLGEVTINYNVTYHGGISGDTLAAYHKQHIEQLERALTEVTYRRNRSAFDGAKAV